MYFQCSGFDREEVSPDLLPVSGLVSQQRPLTKFLLSSQAQQLTQLAEARCIRPRVNGVTSWGGHRQALTANISADVSKTSLRATRLMRFVSPEVHGTRCAPTKSQSHSGDVQNIRFQEVRQTKDSTELLRLGTGSHD